MAVQSIGECGKSISDIKDPSQKQAQTLSTIIQTLIGLLRQKDDEIMTESMVALQIMISKGDAEQSNAIILYCIKMIDKIQSGKAKATMIYLLKEHIDGFPTLSKETFRRLVKGFIDETSDEVKLQIMGLAA